MTDLKSVIDGTKLYYSTDKDGDFVVVIGHKSSELVVHVGGNPSQVTDDYEGYIHIWSRVTELEKDEIKPDKLEELMKNNYKYVMGSWGINSGNDLIFTVKTAVTDLTPEVLKEQIFIVASTAYKKSREYLIKSYFSPEDDSDGESHEDDEEDELNDDEDEENDEEFQDDEDEEDDE